MKRENMFEFRLEKMNVFVEKWFVVIFRVVILEGKLDLERKCESKGWGVVLWWFLVNWLLV